MGRFFEEPRLNEVLPGRSTSSSTSNNSDNQDSQLLLPPIEPVLVISNNSNNRGSELPLPPIEPVLIRNNSNFLGQDALRTTACQTDFSGPVSRPGERIKLEEYYRITDNYFTKDTYEDFSIDNQLNPITYDVRFSFGGAPSFSVGRSPATKENIVSPSFSVLTLPIETVFNQPTEGKDYVFVKWYDVDFDNLFIPPEQRTISQDSANLHNIISLFVPSEAFLDFKFTIPEVNFRQAEQAGENFSRTIDNRGKLEHQISLSTPPSFEDLISVPPNVTLVDSANVPMTSLARLPGTSYNSVESTRDINLPALPQVDNSPIEEQEIIYGDISSLENNQNKNFIFSYKTPPRLDKNRKEYAHNKVFFREPTVVFENRHRARSFVLHYLRSLNFTNFSYSRNPSSYRVSLEQSQTATQTATQQRILDVKRNIIPTIQLLEFDLDSIDYSEISADEKRSLSVWDSENFHVFEQEPQELADLKNTKTRNLEKVYNQELACSDLFMIEIEKYHNETLLQKFYILGGAGNYYSDYQISYGKEYSYKVYEHHFVYGNKIDYKGSTANLAAANSGNRFSFYSHFEYENIPMIKSTKRMVGQTGGLLVASNPYSEPNVEFIPQKGKKNKISLYLENSNSTTRLEKNELELMYPKILDGDYIREQYFSNVEQQRSISYNAISGNSADSGLQTSEFYFRYDAENGIEPKYFEVFRAANKPLNYSDFANSLHARISCKDSEGKIKSSFMFDDSVAENTKYWYMVRVVDTADQPSLPSKIYEYEMIKENDVLIPTITSIDLNPLPKKEVATAKKVVRISPRPEHVILDTDGEIQDSDFEWGSRYKIKMRSVKTGKKIDINFKSTQPIKESIEQN